MSLPTSGDPDTVILSSAPSLAFSPFVLREASGHVVSCPRKRPLWQGPDVSSQQPAKT